MKKKKEPPMVEPCDTGGSLITTDDCDYLWISDENAVRLHAELTKLLPVFHDRLGTAPKPKRITAAQHRAIRLLQVWDDYGFTLEESREAVDEITDAIAGVLLK